MQVDGVGVIVDAGFVALLNKPSLKWEPLVEESVWGAVVVLEGVAPLALELDKAVIVAMSGATVALMVPAIVTWLPTE